MISVRRFVKTFIAATAAAALLAFAGLAGHLSLTSAHASSSSSARMSGVGLLHLGDRLPNATNQTGYSTVIVSMDDASAAAKLPGRSLVYFNGTDVPTDWSTGVPYNVAAANGWLLKNAAGSYVKNTSYNMYIGDVGNSGYQRAWAQNVIAFLKSHHNDGAFIDDVLRDIKSLTGEYPAAYPNQAAWQAAMTLFVKNVGSALRAQGYYTLVNAVGYTIGDGRSNDGTLDISWWKQLGPSVDGLMNESYQELPNGSNTLRTSGTSSWTENWDGWQRLVDAAQTMRKDFVGITYGAPGDTRTMTFGRASFLQEWNGGPSTYVFNPSDNSDPWNRAWTVDIGAPAATKQRVGVGWMRRYTGGVALVNPSASTSQTFQLGDSYLTDAGATISSITLAPTTGAILRSTRPFAPTSVPATRTRVKAGVVPKVTSHHRYYTHKAQVILRSNQQLHFRTGKGYYAGPRIHHRSSG
jgi:hypothetical protein